MRTRRTELLYALVTALNAVSVWLSVAMVSLGASPSEAAAALALLPLLTLTAGPTWGWLSDHVEGAWLRRVSLGVAVAITGLLVAPSLWAFLVATAVLVSCRAGQTPLLDAHVVRAIAGTSTSLGQARAWGSVAFVVAMAAAGLLYDRWPLGVFAVPVLAAWLAWWLLAEEPAPRLTQPAHGGPGAALLTHRVLGPLAVASWLHGLGLTTYNQLFALLITERGLPGWVVSGSVGLGVLAEVGVLWTGRWWLARLGSRRLFLLALASSIPRWWLTGRLSDPIALAAVQTLHGLGFGAFWLAGVTLFSEHAPAGRRQGAQVLLQASTFGAGACCSMALASWWLTSSDVASLLGWMWLPSALATLLVWSTTGGPVADPTSRSDPGPSGSLPPSP